MFASGLPFWVEWAIGALALYGVSHLAVSAVRWLFRFDDRETGPIRCLLWTSDSAQHVEYWLRRIRWMAQVNGRDYRIYWQDEHSGDDTGLIVERMLAETAGADDDHDAAEGPGMLLDLRKGNHEAPNSSENVI